MEGETQSRYLHSNGPEADRLPATRVSAQATVHGLSGMNGWLCGYHPDTGPPRRPRVVP
jgi:hypothetical protein